MNASQRPTLGLPVAQDRRESSNPDRRDNTAAPRKPSMIAKGHDAILKAFQDRQARVQIFPMATEFPIVGKMINRDRYTITVELDNGQRRTVYKHAIESFGEAAAV